MEGTASTTSVLVTGATSGIGRATALRLAGAGYHVVASGRDAGALADLKLGASRPSSSRSPAGRLDTAVLDVAGDGESVEEAARAVRAILGDATPDVLVNNAGFSAPGPLELVGDRELREQFDVNVFGLMAVTRAFVAGMRERGSGRIINVSSVMGRMTLPLHGAYNASKFAVEALSDALRMELAAFGVDVVIVEPGTIRTGFERRALANAGRYRAAESPYRPVLSKIEDVYGKVYEGSPGPETVAETIERAIRARRPRARYISLRDRTQVALFSRLPSSLADSVRRRAVGFQ